MTQRIRTSLLYILVGLAALSPRAGWSIAQRASAEIAFAEGLIAFQQGDDAGAAERFKAAGELNPEEGSPHYWRGLALLRLGRAGEAAAEIEASLRSRRPPDVDRERVRADLAAARRAAERTPLALEPPERRPDERAVDDRGLWDGTAGFLAGQDTNPNLLSQDLSLTAPGRNGVVQGEQADGLGSADLRLGIYPFHAQEGLNLGVSLEARRDFHLDFGYLDVGQARGAVQLALGSDPQGFVEGPLGSARMPFGASRFAALFQAGGAVYRLGSDPYLQTLEGAAAFSVRETPGTATRLDLGYADRKFSGGPLSNPQRSGHDLSLGLSQLFYLWGRNRTLRLGAGWVDRRAGAEFMGSSLEGNGELVLPVALRWSVILEGSVRKDDYDRPESNVFAFNGAPRSDTTVRTEATVVWSVTGRLRWTLQGGYTRRNSNVDLGGGLPDLGYRRAVVSTGLSWEL